jgi:hypothetical protein
MINAIATIPQNFPKVINLFPPVISYLYIYINLALEVMQIFLYTSIKPPNISIKILLHRQNNNCYNLTIFHVITHTLNMIKKTIC